MQRNVVLFDLDGTVLDTYSAILDSLRYATEKVLGASLPDAELTSKVGQPLVTQMKTFAEDHGYGQDVADELTRVYRAYNEKDLDARISYFEGIPEALAALQAAGYRLAVVTSKRHGLAQASVEHFGLMPKYFERLNGAEDSVCHKPDPDPLIQMAKDLGVSVDQCIYVGDSPYDLHAAYAAGMPSIGVTWGKFFVREVLEPEHPAVIIDAPDQLPAAVKELF